MTRDMRGHIVHRHHTPTAHAYLDVPPQQQQLALKQCGGVTCHRAQRLTTATLPAATAAAVTTVLIAVAVGVVVHVSPRVAGHLLPGGGVEIQAPHIAQIAARCEVNM
jgi:hypothetical protein